MNQEYKHILKKTIINYNDHLLRLIDVEKLYVENFISNRKKIRYKWLLFFKIILFLTFCIFSLINVINIVIDVVLFFLLIFLLAIINSSIAEALDNYNYLKFKKRIKLIKSYFNFFSLVISNRFLIEDVIEFNDLKIKINNINDELKFLENSLTSRSSIIINYKIIEILGILVTFSLFIAQYLIGFYDFRIDTLYLLKIPYICALALYLFYLQEFEYPPNLNIDLDGLDDHTFQEILEYRYKKKLDNYNISLKKILKSKFLLPGSKKEKINELFSELDIYEKKEEKEEIFSIFLKNDE